MRRATVLRVVARRWRAVVLRVVARRWRDLRVTNLAVMRVELRARRDEGVGDAVAAPQCGAHERRSAGLWMGGGAVMEGG